MYFIDTLYSLYRSDKRNTLFEISNRIAHDHNTNRSKIMADMLLCSIKYGAMFTEYDDLNFYERTPDNRATYITTYYNFRLYNKINKPQFREIFHNKKKFLSKFNTLIKREWIDIDKCTLEEINSFIERHIIIVLKANHGDSGKEVEVFNTHGLYQAESLLSYMRTHNYDLIEECMVNHPVLASLNESSLNTIRIVTVRNDCKTDFLFAGLRIGAKGKKLDNISQGGAVARINIEKGCIETPFYTKRSAGNENYEFSNAIGVVLPYWDELKQLAERASTIVESIGIVAWDICITPNGPEIIEGNESFGSVIMQLYNNTDEAGLLPKLNKIFNKE